MLGGGQNSPTLQGQYSRVVDSVRTPNPDASSTDGQPVVDVSKDPLQPELEHGYIDPKDDLYLFPRCVVTTRILTGGKKAIARESAVADGNACRLGHRRTRPQTAEASRSTMSASILSDA